MRNNRHVSRSHVIIEFLAKDGPILVCVSSAAWLFKMAHDPNQNLKNKNKKNQNPA